MGPPPLALGDRHARAVKAIRVILERGGTPESAHVVAGDVHELRSGRSQSFGDPELAAFWRSSMKPFQALPVVRDGVLARLGLGSEVLALACASHHATQWHVDLVTSVLAAIELSPEALVCGPHRPFDADAAQQLDRAGVLPGRVHNNCSGQHAAMLALAVARDWPVTGYHEPEHPLQQAVRAELSAWLGLDCEGLPWGVDGCGLPTPALSLHEMARAYARLGSSDEAPVRAVAAAMTAHPMLVSGPTALSANVMRATSGRILAKEGAEGLFCLASREAGWGGAFKVLDGATRALGPAIVHALSSLSLLSAEEAGRLREFARPAVSNTRGREVAALSVERDGG
ncbi:asparaginase [Candidatus Palauibacter sp.]|uniref:asparaginase n=1 Tax=Candidatus Palauibacter sp. TaxID=3101350 RepID=UPI003B5A6EE2